MAPVPTAEKPLLAPAPPAPSRGARRREVVLPVLGLFLLTALVYGVLGQRQPLPIVAPDEYTYGHLVRGIADGTGYDWRGEHLSLPFALYLYAVVPGWLLASGETAYELAKAESALLVALAVVPVFLVGRELVGPRLAALAAVLAVAGTWMVSAAGLLTENLAYPLAAGALLATVAALRRPGHRVALVALGLALLTTWARTQLVVILPAVLGAFLLDVAWAGGAWRARARAHRTVLLAGAAVVVAGGIVAVAVGPASVGSYGGVYHYSPALDDIARRIGGQLVGLTAQTAFLPVLLALGLATSRRAWLDDVVGPLLKVFWPAAVLLAVQSGWYLAGFGAAWGVERYVQYAAPVALLLTIAAFTRRELLTWRVLGVTVAAALPLLLAAGLRGTGEERAVFATSDVLGLSVPAALTLTAAALGLLALVVSRSLRLQAEPMRGALVIGGVLLAVLVVQSQATWRWQLDVTRTWRTELPSDLSWVDHHAGGDVGLLLLTSANPRFADLDFFNKRVTQVYVPPAPITAKGLRGERCGWGVGQGGALQVGPECGELPSRFLLQDPGARIAFHGEREIARDPKFGRIVAVPDSPRVRSVLELPCNDPVLTFEGRRFTPVPASEPRLCRGVLSGAFWLDFPATAVLRFRGGTAEHHAAAGRKTYKLPAGEDTTIRLPVAAGAATLQLRLDWRSTAGAPELVDARLEGAGGSTPLL